MVHRTELLYRVYAACHLAFGAAALVVLAVSGPNLLGAAVAVVFVPVWVFVVSRVSQRPPRVAPDSGVRLAPASQTIRRALLFNVAALVVYVPVLLLLRRDAGGWNLAAILIGSGLGNLLVVRDVRAAEASEPTIVQTTRMAFGGRGGRIAWPREWGDTAPAGATPAA